MVPPAPQIDYLTLPAITHDAVLGIVGSHFAAATTSGTLAVLVDGQPADVLQSDDSTIVFTHGVTTDPSLFYTTKTVVVSVNGQTSNPATIEVVPAGTALALPAPLFSGPGAITIAANGEQIVVDNNYGVVDRLAPNGDMLFNPVFPTDPNGDTLVKAWELGTSFWTLDASGNLNKYDAANVLTRVAHFSAGNTVVDGQWDSAGNFYALDASAEIYFWDSTTHVVSAFTTVQNAAASFTATSFTIMGTEIYVADDSNGAIIDVPIATPASSATFVVNGGVVAPRALTNDGAQLILWANGAVSTVDAMGTVAQFSAFVPDFTGDATGLAVDAGGKIFVSSPLGFIARYTDAMTIEPWAVFPAGWAYGYTPDGHIFNGNTAPGYYGGDIDTGVLYEYRPDGTLRRVTNRLSTPEWHLPFVAGKFWEVNKNNGNVETIDPMSGAIGVKFDNTVNNDLAGAYSVDLDAAGNIYVSCQDPANGNIGGVAKITAGGVLVSVGFATNPSGSTAVDTIAIQGNRVVGLASNQLWTAPLATGGVGTFITNPTNLGSAGAYVAPYDFWPDGNGNLVFVNHYNSENSVLRLTPQNDLQTVFAAAGTSLEQVSLDTYGNLWGFDSNDNLVLVLP